MEKSEVRNFLLGYLSKDISKTKVVGEDLMLIAKAKQGDKDAVKRVIENNIRIVVKLASNFKVSSDVFMDLISEGCLGIMRAIRKYDFSKGVKFSSYASIWIRHNILSYLSRNSPVRVPVRKKKILKYVKGKLKDAKDCPAEDALNDVGISPEEYQRLFAVNNVICFSELCDESSYPVFENCLVSEDEVSKKAEIEFLSGLLEEKISRLSPRERFVIEHRYGLNKKDKKKLVEIAKILGSTPEGVRYTEKNAIAKLRRMLKSELSL